jgi:Flp pilus assembly pilin Flp
MSLVRRSLAPDDLSTRNSKKGDIVYGIETGRMRLVRRLRGERGQGTVEYVGLILLVSLLMVGMVAAMKGFQGEQGLEIAEVIVAKIKSAVNAITFK